MAPWLETLRRTHAERLDVVEINLDRSENVALGRFFENRAVPVQVYLNKTGNKVAIHRGIATLEEMTWTLERNGLIPAGRPHEPSARR
jgi:thioredoxin-like negative regulator of GroEL